jgi:hypothetical protein
MVPLLPMPALPEQATPTDAPAANPFLALLTQLVGAPAPVAEPEPTPETPVDGDAEPEDGDQPDTEALVLPVVPQLAAALAVAPPPTTAAPTTKTVKDAPEAKVEVAPEASLPGPAQAPAPAPAQVAPQQQVASTGPLPMAAPTAVAPVTSVSAPAPAPAPVVHQVFPEVVRVAVTGETPRRVVVRLEPEHLGEVRIVLRTGRAGLEVSLAAGVEARAAIREGAPELRRMLEAAGSPDARILVRHLSDAPSVTAPVTATAPVAPSTPVRTDAPPVHGMSVDVDVGAGTAGGTAHGDRRDRPQQDAPPRAGDGRPDRPLEPAVRRTSGLDVMM